MKFCQNCGTQLSDETKFCHECGSQVQTIETPITETPVEEIAVTETPNTETVVIKPTAEAVITNTASQSTYIPSPAKPKYNGLAIAGFTISMISILLNFFGLVSLVGFIFSLIGMSQAKSNGESGMGLAVAGVIVGIICTILSIMTTCTCLSLCCSPYCYAFEAFGELSELPYYFDM